MDVNAEFMKRAIELARRGGRAVMPNPMVGAVLTCGDQVIGEGCHERFGGPHAEVQAAQSISDERLLRSSTLYVTLEPCCHHGKTPPCVDLITAVGIPRVVVACVDPFSRVRGQGIQRLVQSGVEVVENTMRTEAILMNRRFLLAHRLKRPYIILKWAQSVDGFIAPDQVGPYWMTSDASRCLVHAWRAREASILVGRLTAQMDNPRLTARCPPDGPMGPNPTRVVLDPEGRLTPDLHLFDSAADTIVFSRVSRNDAGRTSRICLRSEESLISQVCCHLYERDLISVIVEGGTRTLQGFIDSGVWDEARVFVTPSPLKKGTVAPQFPHTSAFQYSVGDDELYRYFHPDLYSRLGIMESMQTGSLLAMVEE